MCGCKSGIAGRIISEVMQEDSLWTMTFQCIMHQHTLYSKVNYGSEA
jgi:hypothetical protein